MNPYLAEFERCKYLVHAFTERSRLVAQYAWAVPNREAIRTLVALSPIIELGAGTGYWASLIAAAGGQIKAFDARPPGPTNQYGHRIAYFPVGRTPPRTFKKATLFLCWPCYHKDWAARAVARYRGATIAYIGEDSGGCTGTEKFHDLLAEHFTLDTTVRIPQWPGLHDQLWVYRR